MTEKRASVKFITPRGIAIYPKLHKPDTKFKSEGQYSVKLRLNLDAFPEKLVEELTTLRAKQVEQTKAELKAKKEGAKLKGLKVRDVFTTETNKETGEETGFVVINAKMTASGISKKEGKPWTRTPLVFDAKRKIMKPVPAIFGGSELKVAVEAVAYYTPKDNEVGVTFYLEAVQVLKLVKGGDRDASSYGFGEEEGFEDADGGSEGFADESEGGGDDASGGPAPASGAEF